MALTNPLGLILLPKSDQLLPFHFTMLFAGIPPAVVMKPPTYKSLICYIKEDFFLVFFNFVERMCVNLAFLSFRSTIDKSFRLCFSLRNLLLCKEHLFVKAAGWRSLPTHVRKDTKDSVVSRLANESEKSSGKSSRWRPMLPTVPKNSTVCGNGAKSGHWTATSISIVKHTQHMSRTIDASSATVTASAAQKYLLI